ncbi:phage GP46 family protein [Sphingomonas canadensis]|uniref:Phage GP46 family protein n=1 Tax=Sphingomonas canadensis TaxID=1219257 RepID=A0ABW3H521_9SPHN|nr:phage GP46 family protein [Sphingomonas canadensis]MCW3835962.1 phage GP46 family protein [Sphingomonas canadensis]
MTDIALIFDAAAWAADLALADGDLVTDDGLMTAIAISLFTDARARDDDPLPAGADRRGWWGDAFNDRAEDRTGSRLWLLDRGKLTPGIEIEARDIAREALAWLIEDQVVSALEVSAEVRRPSPAHPAGALAIIVQVARPSGPARMRFDAVWDATTRAITITRSIA